MNMNVLLHVLHIPFYISLYKVQQNALKNVHHHILDYNQLKNVNLAVQFLTIPIIIHACVLHVLLVAWVVIQVDVSHVIKDILMLIARKDVTSIVTQHIFITLRINVTMLVLMVAFWLKILLLVIHVRLNVLHVV